MSSEQLSDFEPKGAACAAFGVLHEAGFPQRALVAIDEQGVVRWSYQAASPGELPSLELLRSGLQSAFARAPGGRLAADAAGWGRAARAAAFCGARAACAGLGARMAPPSRFAKLPSFGYKEKENGPPTDGRNRKAVNMSSDAVTRVSAEIAGSEISFETGRMAKQASGAVVVRQGDTMVLATAVAGGVRDVDFLPLTVDVEERMYAAGKIPGSFFKREGRPGEKGTLTARMIDRPIRPLFPKEWRYDTQLVAIPLSIDHVHPYDILAMNGASAALMISDIPLPTPVGAVRIGKVEGNFVVNPAEPDLLAEGEHPSDLDLVVAGTEEAILMVEAGASEIPEAEILDALDIAHAEIKKLCALQRDLAAKVGKEKKPFVTLPVDEQLLEQIRASHGEALDRATQVEDKLERQDATSGRRDRRARALRAGGPRGRLRAAAARRQGSPRRGAARLRQAREVDHPRAHRRRTSAGPTDARRTRSATSRSRSACSRARTARRCSRAARRRR